MTRSDDRFVSLKIEPSSNDNKANLFISIHANGF